MVDGIQGLVCCHLRWKRLEGGRRGRGRENRNRRKTEGGRLEEKRGRRERDKKKEGENK